ncbi:hypothetical protein [Acidaminococcus fermentans]|uniref:hypothetical protein n=1 Tax=Acidaminococcus fermentans TaxID=905 RepID=UPI003D048B4D
MLLNRIHIANHNIRGCRLPHFLGIMEKTDFSPHFFKTAHGLKKILVGRPFPLV